jgi:hypothetical protein
VGRKDGAEFFRENVGGGRLEEGGGHTFLCTPCQDVRGHREAGGLCDTKQILTGEEKCLKIVSMCSQIELFCEVSLLL